MDILILVVLALVVGILIYLANLDGDYLVRRSLDFAVPVDVVYDKVRDLKSWPSWSPWLLHEPDTRLEFSDAPDKEGGWYRWDGKHVGAGTLRHDAFEAGRRINQRIEFTRPFKSVCSVWWEFEATTDGQTTVVWCMQGRMPFLFRFMTAATRRMIDKDYDLGLRLLRGVLQPDAERPLLQFPGRTTRPAVSALTIGFTGGLKDMQTAMQEGFPGLVGWAQQQEAIAGAPFTAYHKVDTRQMQFDCDMAVPVATAADAGDYVRKDFPGGSYFKVTLQGSYEFMELAWYSAMAHLRMLKINVDSGRPSFEVYENDPASVAHTNEIETSLYIPVR